MLGKQILLTSKLTKRIFSYLAPRDRDALREVMNPNGIIATYQKTFVITSGLEQKEVSVAIFTKRNGKLLLHITDYKKSATKEISLPNNEKVTQLYSAQVYSNLSTFLLSDRGIIYLIEYQWEAGIRIHDAKYVTFVGRTQLEIKTAKLKKTFDIVDNRLFLTETGQLRRIYPQVNINSNDDFTIAMPTPNNEKVKSISDAAGNYVLYLSEEGNLYSYEKEKFKNYLESKVRQHPTPVLLSLPNVGKINQLADVRDGSNSTTLAFINEQGKVFELEISPLAVKPVVLPDNEYATQVFYDQCHAYIVTRSGALYGLGPNSSGELGLGHRKPVTTPTQIILPQNEKARQISVEYGCAFVVTRSDAVCVFGKNNVGQLLLGHKINVPVPTRLNIANDKQVTLTLQQLPQVGRHFAPHRQTVITVTELPDIRIIVNDRTSIPAQSFTDPSNKYETTPVAFESMIYCKAPCQPPAIIDALRLMHLNETHSLQLNNIIVSADDFPRLMRFITPQHYLHVILLSAQRFKCFASTNIRSPECVFVTDIDAQFLSCSGEEIRLAVSQLPKDLEKNITIYRANTISDSEIVPALLAVANITSLTIFGSKSIHKFNAQTFFNNCLRDNFRLTSLVLGEPLPNETHLILIRNKSLRNFKIKSRALSTGLTHIKRILLENNQELIQLHFSDILSQLGEFVTLFIFCTQVSIDCQELANFQMKSEYGKLMSDVFILCFTRAKDHRIILPADDLKKLMDSLGTLIKFNDGLKRKIYDDYEPEYFYNKYGLPNEWVSIGYELYFRCAAITTDNFALALIYTETLIGLNHKDAIKITLHAAQSFIQDFIENGLKEPILKDGIVVAGVCYKSDLKLCYKLLRTINSLHYLRWDIFSFVKTSALNETNARLFAPVTLQIVCALLQYQVISGIKRDEKDNGIKMDTHLLSESLKEAQFDSAKLLALMKSLIDCYGSIFGEPDYIADLRNILIPRAKFAHQIIRAQIKESEDKKRAAEFKPEEDECVTLEENEGGMELRPISSAFFQGAPRVITPLVAEKNLMPRPANSPQ